MLLQRRFFIQRTPLDIPIALFIASQFLSTIFSIDHTTSFWGYYSRFNGGFLSLLSYVFLYYAFASNVLDEDKKHTIRTIGISLLSGIAVAMWGFPSHFGYDPTCYIFRGTFDVSCWTSAFQPKARIFSTLGQPNWLAAFLAILLPVALGFGLKFISDYFANKKENSRALLKGILAFAVALLFYVDITWTDSQSGFIGLWIGLVIFFGILMFQRLRNKQAQKSLPVVGISAAVIAVMLGVSVMLGTPINRLKQFTLQQINKQQTAKSEEAALPALEFGGTDSSKIRLIVWKGALDIAKTNPLFGSGVETFAYAYYKHRPAEHNLTSEWDYLYNKAHNEYLNYLATTGIFGLGSYLLFIGWFYALVLKSLKNTKQSWLLSSALVGGWTSILVSNFFGFSVVVTNLFLFLIPLWFLHLAYPKFELNKEEAESYSSSLTTVAIISLALFVLFLEIILLRYWLADKHYALGNNLDKVGEYVTANPELVQAIQLKPKEDLFKDELSVNLATLALAYQQQNESTMAGQLAQQAKSLSDMVVSNRPNNVVFWKSRTRVLYSLAQIDSGYYPLAIDAIEKTHDLAPTDAKVMYNRALMYDQGGNREKAISILEETIKLKSNYRDAYYALALIASEHADEIESKQPQEADRLREKARENLQVILKHLMPDDKQAQELMKKLQ